MNRIYKEEVEHPINAPEHRELTFKFKLAKVDMHKLIQDKEYAQGVLASMVNQVIKNSLGYKGDIFLNLAFPETEERVPIDIEYDKPTSRWKNFLCWLSAPDAIVARGHNWSGYVEHPLVEYRACKRCGVIEKIYYNKEKEEQND